MEATLLLIYYNINKCGYSNIVLYADILASEMEIYIILRTAICTKNKRDEKDILAGG